MLKFGEVNPLAVFGLRRVEHCPPHFTCVVFDARVTDKELSDWVYTNLTGRFYIGDQYSTSDSGAMTMSKSVAFENAGEASYFAIQLDTINTPHYG